MNNQVNSLQIQNKHEHQKDLKKRRKILDEQLLASLDLGSLTDQFLQ